MLLDESYFDTFPVEVKEKYVLVQFRGTEFEIFIGAYDTEIQAYTIARRIESKNKEVLKAFVEYIQVETLTMIKGYKVIRE